MQQVSNILKFNVKISYEVNEVDTTKNKLKNKIHHTKNRSRHASNQFKYDCIIGNN